MSWCKWLWNNVSQFTDSCKWYNRLHQLIYLFTLISKQLNETLGNNGKGSPVRDLFKNDITVYTNWYVCLHWYVNTSTKLWETMERGSLVRDLFQNDITVYTNWYIRLH